MATKLEKFRRLLTKEMPSNYALDEEHENWLEQVVATIDDPEIAAALPALVADLDSKTRSRLIPLEVEPLQLAMLGCAKGAQLGELVKCLVRARDPEGRILRHIAEHPAAAKHALEHWTSTNEPLLALARLVADDKKCKTIAARALEYGEVFADAPDAMVPPFPAYLALERIGAKWKPDGAAAETAQKAGRAARWLDRIEWPHKSFKFVIPKHSKSVLTLDVDPSRDTEHAWNGRSLDLVAFGYDDQGWGYFWWAETGAVVRTQGDALQWLLYFFDWIGEEVARPSKPTNPFVGTWRAKSITYHSSPDGDPDFYPEPMAPAKNEARLVLDADGGCVFQRFSHERAGQYECLDGGLRLRLPNETIDMTSNIRTGRLEWVDKDEEHGSDVTIELARA